MCSHGDSHFTFDLQIRQNFHREKGHVVLYIYPIPCPFFADGDVIHLAWAYIALTVLAVVLGVVMMMAWCAMCGDECYCIPQDDEEEIPDV